VKLIHPVALKIAERRVVVTPRADKHEILRLFSAPQPEEDLFIALGPHDISPLIKTPFYYSP
jgi:hypothetical protein